MNEEVTSEERPGRSESLMPQTVPSKQIIDLDQSTCREQSPWTCEGDRKWSWVRWALS